MERFEDVLEEVDLVLDTVGGKTQQRSLEVLKRDGILVSIVSPVPKIDQERHGVRAAYFYVDVTTTRLNEVGELFDSSQLVTDLGAVLHLEQARLAHEMFGGSSHDGARSCSLSARDRRSARESYESGA